VDTETPKDVDAQITHVSKVPDTKEPEVLPPSKASTNGKFQLRELKDSDLDKIRDIFANASDDIKRKIARADSDQQMGIMIADVVLGPVWEQVTNLLAELTGKEREDLLEAKFGTRVELIERLMHENDLKDFFERISRLRNTFAKIFEIDSASDSDIPT